MYQINISPLVSKCVFFWPCSNPKGNSGEMQVSALLRSSSFSLGHFHFNPLQVVPVFPSFYGYTSDVTRVNAGFYIVSDTSRNHRCSTKWARNITIFPSSDKRIHSQPLTEMIEKKSCQHILGENQVLKVFIGRVWMVSTESNSFRSFIS